MGKNKGGEKAASTLSIVQLFIAEFVGTGLLLFLGCMGCIGEAASIPISHHMVALTFGLTVMLIIQIFGHISGAHLNPAVSIAAYILGHLNILTCIVYITGQYSGATLGFGLLKLLVPEEYVATEVYFSNNITIKKIGLCSTIPNAKVSSMQALGLEAIITAVLILIACAIWDKRNAAKMDSVPLKFGFGIVALAMAAAPFTGSSMNPARSFAPALLNGDWDQHWIYWVGPMLGAVLATLFYKFLYSVPEIEPMGEESHELNEIDNGTTKGQ